MTKAKNFFKRLLAEYNAAPHVPAIDFVQLDPLNLRLVDWRKNGALVTKAGMVLKQQTLRAMLQVLKNETPANLGLAIVGTRPEDRAALQAKIEGFHLAINMLESMDKPITKQEPLVATFEAPEQETNYASKRR